MSKAAVARAATATVVLRNQLGRARTYIDASTCSTGDIKYNVLYRYDIPNRYDIPIFIVPGRDAVGRHLRCGSCCRKLEGS
jgi:hypothetical protein